MLYPPSNTLTTRLNLFCNSGSKTTCELCPKGWKRGDVDIDLTKCVQCKLGETTQNDGSTTCSQCGFGEYGNIPGNCTSW